MFKVKQTKIAYGSLNYKTLRIAMDFIFMILAMGVIGKFSETNVAFKRFFTRVDAHVSIEITAISKLLETNGAMVYRQAIVYNHMAAQTNLTREFFVASCTTVTFLQQFVRRIDRQS